MPSDKKVWSRLRKHYPAEVLDWVRGKDWSREQVPLDQIHMQARPGHPRDEGKVRAIRGKIRDGAELPPVVLVRTPKGRAKIADGYHRLEALKDEGVPHADALVARAREGRGPWSRQMHDAASNHAWSNAKR